MEPIAFDVIFDAAIENSVRWLNTYLPWFFEGLRGGLDGILWLMTTALSMPAWLFMVLAVGLALYFSGWGLALFAVISLPLCYMAGLWSETIVTLALVFTATFFALLIGIPLGIWGGSSKWGGAVLSPVLDTLQTLPPYVYLLPAIALVGYGGASAIIATILLAIAPAVRLTMLGFREIPLERLELGKALGGRYFQTLFAIRLPSAMPSIMAGINQSLMMSLGMAVIAGLIGAGGLGGEVYRAIRYLEVGRAFDAGLAIVVLSILIDRISEGAVRKMMKEAVNG